MREKYFVECGVHGQQEAAFVCRHIVRSLSSGEPVGFYYAEDSDATYPDAWCGECEGVRIECGGEWTEEVEKGLGISIICGACHEKARKICLAVTRATDG